MIQTPRLFHQIYSNTPFEWNSFGNGVLCYGCRCSKSSFCFVLHFKSAPKRLPQDPPTRLATEDFGVVVAGEHNGSVLIYVEA